jgi:hypothetical protein
MLKAAWKIQEIHVRQVLPTAVEAFPMTDEYEM